MATLVATQISYAGGVHTLAALTESPNQFANVIGKTFIIVKNTGAGAHTLTFQPTVTVPETGGSALPLEPVDVALTAGQEKIVGPWSGNFQTGSNIVFTVDSVPAEISAKVYKLP